MAFCNGACVIWLAKCGVGLRNELAKCGVGLRNELGIPIHCDIPHIHACSMYGCLSACHNL